MPDYSIVATTYNDENEILSYLVNICEQNLPPAEVVIADGGSNDDTVAVIERFALNSDIPVRVVKNGRLNISQGYNEAIRATRTDLIGVTGIGNEYEKDYFQKLLAHFEQETCDMTYSPIRGKDNGAFSEKYNNTILHGKKGLRLSIASNHGALVKKHIFEDLGFFYEKFIYAGEDAEFYTLVAARDYKIERVDDALVYWSTPTSYPEYLRQIKVYSIAELQIHDHKILSRNAIIAVLPILLAMILTWYPIYLLIYVGLSLFAVFVLTLKFYTEKKSIILWLCNKFLPFFYYVKYRKYYRKEYQVKR